MDEPSAPSKSMLAAVALGTSFLCLVKTLLLLVSPHHHVIYHLAGPVSALFVPAIADTLLFAAFVFALLIVTRPHLKVMRAALALLACFMPWVAVSNLGEIAHHSLPPAWSNAWLIVATLAFLALGFAPSQLAKAVLHFAWQGTQAVLAIAGVVGAVTLAQVAWFGWQAHGMNTHAAVQTTLGVGHPQGRVIWIVLDELAQDQVYGRRLPGLALPNFDRLRADSTVFTNVAPAGNATEVVLPILMSGQSADRIVSSADGRIVTLVLPHGSGGTFDAQNNVFHDAGAMDYRSGIAGWFNPYCRMLAGELTSCAWISHADSFGLFPDDSVLTNLLHPIPRLWGNLAAELHPGRTTPDVADEARLHTLDYQVLSRAASDAINDPRLNFVLLHLPIPHPGGIWNRRTQQFVPGRSSYVDNLALADLWLGQLRAQLEARGEWDDATILLMGDHSWRTTLLWDGRADWTAEDQAASHGGAFDPRPAYVLKLPHQHAAAAIDTRFAAGNTRALLDQLLAHRIATPEQLANWVAQQPPPSKSPRTPSVSESAQ